MKNVKRFLSLLTALLLCISMLTLPASAADDSKMLAEVKKGVVQLLAIVYKGDKTSGIPIDACTGTGSYPRVKPSSFKISDNLSVKRLLIQIGPHSGDERVGISVV